MEETNRELRGSVRRIEEEQILSEEAGLEELIGLTEERLGFGTPSLRKSFGEGGSDLKSGPVLDSC